jgi:hypothetical protein
MGQAVILTMRPCSSSTHAKMRVVLLDKVVIAMSLSAILWLYVAWRRVLSACIDLLDCKIPTPHRLLLTPCLWLFSSCEGNHCARQWPVDEIVIDIYWDCKVHACTRLRTSDSPNTANATRPWVRAHPVVHGTEAAHVDTFQHVYNLFCLAKARHVNIDKFPSILSACPPPRSYARF